MQEAHVLTHDMCIEVPCDGHVNILRYIGPERCRYLRHSVRANSGLVIYPLLGGVVFLEEGEELDNIRVLNDRYKTQKVSSVSEVNCK